MYISDNFALLFFVNIILVYIWTVVDQVSTAVLKLRGCWVRIHLMYANQTGETLKA